MAGRPAHNAEEFEQTIKEVAAEPNSGVLVLWDFLTLAHRVLIAQLTVQYRLPSCYGMRDFATSGGLISYGVDSIDLFRRSATYVDRILKGARPADLPVQEPTKFVLVINLKTAKLIGLTVPPSLLAAADELIE